MKKFFKRKKNPALGDPALGDEELQDLSSDKNLKLDDLHFPNDNALDPKENDWPSQAGRHSETALWEAERDAKKLSGPIGDKAISQEAFDALTLVQAMINEAKQILLYGSWLQPEDLLANVAHDGITPVNGQTLARIDKGRDLIDRLYRANRDSSHSVGLSKMSYDVALRGITSGHFEAGNCGEHSGLLYALLIKYGYPGLKIYYCESWVEDHHFVIVEGKDSNGKPFKVVCDGWPKEFPQAVMWEDHRSFYKDGKEDINYKVVVRHEITPENMGRDILEEAATLISNDQLRVNTEQVNIKDKYLRNELDDTVFNILGIYIDNLGRNIANTREGRFYPYVAPDGKRVVEHRSNNDTETKREGPDDNSQDSIGIRERWTVTPTFPIRKTGDRYVAELNTENDPSKRDRSQLPDFSRPTEEFLFQQEIMRERRWIDNLAKKKLGKNKACAYKSPDELNTRLGRNAQVVLKSHDGLRTYAKHRIPGQSPDHLEIAVLSNDYTIVPDGNINNCKDVSALVVGEKIKGQDIKLKSMVEALRNLAQAGRKKKSWRR